MGNQSSLNVVIGKAPHHFFARPTTAHNAGAIKSDAPTNAATNHRPSVVDVVTREASKKLFVVIFSEPKGGRGVLG
jgi:hypothetical protein